MSIVRVGMSDNKKVSQGWEAIFGKKKPATAAKAKKPVKGKKK